MGAFRHDINGLRALAVVSVLLFHFQAPGFGGGFVGVDVFFVISGYLMTLILRRGTGAERVSLWAFYAARVRRIVPALLALCAVLLVGGFFIIDPLTYGSLASEALASMLFVSNFLYERQLGYFAPNSKTNWLLHSWSLSVEFQFYLLYPLALMALRAWSVTRGRIGPLLVLATLLSFAVAVFLAGRDAALAKTAFFMLPTRVWEMLLGGVVAVSAPASLRSPALARALEVGGLGLIAASILVFSERTVWPSAATALPVVGAALVIWAGRADAGWSRLPGVAAIGRWSYSIYLWHWPLLVAANYLEGAHRPGMLLALMALSIGFGALSYWLAELKLRDALFVDRTLLGRGARVAAVALVVGFAALAVHRDGFETLRTRRLPAQIQAELRDYRQARDDWSLPEACRSKFPVEPGVHLCWAGRGGPPQALVIGDSHAQQLAQRYGDRDDVTVAFLANGGCPPVPNFGSATTGNRCQAFTEAAFRHAASGAYRRVVVIASWHFYFPTDRAGVACLGGADNCQAPATPEAWNQAARLAGQTLATELASLKAQGVEPVLMLDFPWLKGEDPRYRYKTTFKAGASQREPYPLSRYQAEAGRINQELTRAAAAVGVRVVDPSDHLCADGLCPLEDGGRYFYYDYGHYRASVMASPRFEFLDAYLASSTLPPEPPA